MPRHTEAERRKRREEVPESKGGAIIKLPSGEFKALTPEETRQRSAEFTEEQGKRQQALRQERLRLGLTEPTKEEIGVRAQLGILPGQLEEEQRLEQLKATEEAIPELIRTAEEQRIFEPVVQEPIIEEEKENLGVIKDIGLSLIPESIRKTFKQIDTLGGTLDFEEAPRTRVEADLQRQFVTDAVQSEIGNEIDNQIEQTEQKVLQQGIPLLGVVLGAVVAGAVAQPVGQFVGSDKTISNLELALSQYNEMVTLPSQSVVKGGLTPQAAFDKLNRMEDGILAIESEIKKAAITSPTVRISLRGRGLDARLLKLKEKIQNERREVLAQQAARAFGEVPITSSMAFLHELQERRADET